MEKGVVIPARAVQSGRDEAYVYVITKDNKAEYRKVVVASEAQGESVISSGMQQGEVVATTGQVRLAPGISVTIRPN